MRVFVIITVLVGLLIAALAVHEARLRRQIQAANATNHSLMENLEALSNRLVETQTQLENPRLPETTTLPVGHAQASGPASEAGSNRIAALENRIQSLTKELTRNKAVQTFPEYDPTLPTVPEIATAPATNAPPGRHWGEEQIVGPPDTSSAGDIPTAWASREPDAGPEWLAAGFDSAMDIAEVRIRETYNPGAITSVTALVNGQEVVLWEGTAAPGGAAPRDFVVRPPFNISANSVFIHLDTARVPGWNEIDAVELVGRDGSRQWASSANASSTYGRKESTPHP